MRIITLSENTSLLTVCEQKSKSVLLHVFFFLVIFKNVEAYLITLGSISHTLKYVFIWRVGWRWGRQREKKVLEMTFIQRSSVYITVRILSFLTFYTSFGEEKLVEFRSDYVQRILFSMYSICAGSTNSGVVVRFRNIFSSE